MVLLHFPQSTIDSPASREPQGARVECMRVGVYRADIKESLFAVPQTSKAKTGQGF